MNKKSLLAIALISAISSHTFSQIKPQIPNNWHHIKNDSIYGVNTDGGYTILQNSLITLKPIVVSVIDGDLDIHHEDLKSNLWYSSSKNSKYTGLNNGWNFLGTKDGESIRKVGTEAFREYKRLRPKFERKKESDFKKEKDLKAFRYFQAVKADAKIQSYLNFFPYIKMTYESYEKTDSVAKIQFASNYNRLLLEDISKLKVSDTTTQQYIDAAQRSSYRFSAKTPWSEVLTYQRSEYTTAEQRVKSLDNTSNPRDKVGDKRNKLSDKYYGNANLVDSASFHGTFVAGLIGACRTNGLGIDGIAANAQIMGIRAVPDGDEFDKDIALSIRFAVDHGAKIINMSFGKYYSPHSKWVTDAISYALKHDVLVIQAAGNDKKDLDTTVSYPQAPRSIKAKHDSYLLIGASDISGKRAAFSNYGKEKVDFFAPGDKVTSTVTFNKYQTASGTSFAAPIVSGIAAVVWGAYPELKAHEVAEILKLSATKNRNKQLENLAKIPGIVNLNDALELAKEYVKK